MITDQDKLRTIFNSMFLSKSEVAESIGMSPQRFSRFLKNKEKLGLSAIEKMNDYLDQNKPTMEDVIMDCQTCGTSIKELGFCPKCDTDAYSY